MIDINLNFCYATKLNPTRIARSQSGGDVAVEPFKPDVLAKLLDWVQNLLGLKFPWYVTFPLGILVFLALVVSILSIIFTAVSKIKEIWLEKLLPHTYKAEQRQRAANRRTFASYLSREIVNRNIAEKWRDEEFADLEAEVETEGDRRSLVPFLRRRGLRRERSLTRALERSTERLILVEGDPGSGKSVALRHVALRLSEAAAKARRSDSRLPVFVNLKEIKRSNEPVDRLLIRRLVFETLTRVNDHFVDEFLDTNFDDGIKNGLFVFVFDSFDEIPEILSSTQSDDLINNYSSAISDFLSGMNQCRGIVASRSYKGPERQGWRTFRILELSSTRQETLIKRALALKPELVPNLLGELSLAQEDVRAMARNPMLLGLLCEHVRSGSDFPSTPYDVFSRYVERRFDRDAERIRSRWPGLSTDELRVWAERAAFTMTADRTLGLSPRRGDLRSALRREYPRLRLTELDPALDALEYIKFGRNDGSTETGDGRQFTFSHRRFQEYFTTRVVKAHPDRVEPIRLLTDARWRETAVVLLQTGSALDTQAIVTAVTEFLEDTERDQDRTLSHEQHAGLSGPGSAARFPEGIPWPAGVLHILGILQAGFAASPDVIPDRIKTLSAKLLVPAFHHGNLLDRKFVIEVAGTVPQETLLTFVRDALVTDSQWLNDATYRQLSRLSHLPEDILAWIRATILRWGLTGQLARNWHGVRAHMMRLEAAPELLRATRLARWITRLDYVLLLALVAGIFFYNWGKSVEGAEAVAIVGASFTTLLLAKLYWLLWGLTATLLRAMFILEFLVIGSVVSVHNESSPTNELIAVAGYFVPLAFVFYVSLWGPAAARCVRSGTFLGVAQWPLAPLIFIRDSYQGAGSVLRFCFKQPKQALKIFVFLLCVVSLWSVYMLNVKKIPDKFMIWPMGTLWACFIGGMAWYLILLARDWVILRSFSVRARSVLDAQILTGSYARLATGTFRLSLLRRVKDYNSLPANATSEAAVRKLLADIEHTASDGVFGRSLKGKIFPRAAEQRDILYMMLETLSRDRVTKSLGGRAEHGFAAESTNIEAVAAEPPQEWFGAAAKPS